MAQLDIMRCPSAPSGRAAYREEMAAAQNAKFYKALDFSACVAVHMREAKTIDFPVPPIADDEDIELSSTFGPDTPKRRRFIAKAGEVFRRGANAHPISLEARVFRSQ
jgi:hypothetical protein